MASILSRPQWVKFETSSIMRKITEKCKDAKRRLMFVQIKRCSKINACQLNRMKHIKNNDAVAPKSGFRRSTP